MTIKNNIFLACSIVAVLWIWFAGPVQGQGKREMDFNEGWFFKLSEEDMLSKPISEDWQAVRLPHDWSIGQAYDTLHLEGATGYLPGGIGWYKKEFYSPEQGDEINSYLLFDGVYNHSKTYINGQLLGYQAYGYSPFYFDISPYLNPPGQKNTLTVKVDRSRYADSRWYPGAGIYRNVKMIQTGKFHIPVWGVFVTTPEIDGDTASLAVQYQLKNDHPQTKEARLLLEIAGPSGEVVKKESWSISQSSGSKETHQKKITLHDIKRWGIDQPNLYQLSLTVSVDGEKQDEYATSFGIREFYFDAATGFYLNGENMKIKGVCLHHDGGLVGSAVPKDVWRRRLAYLKEAGCNAVRISHNPAAEELLDLCDEMGFLVQDEFYDEWDYPKDKRLNMNEQHDDYISRGSAAYFQENAEKDLKATVRAHRNHPSIFQWSIGNEIEWTYPRNKLATGFWDADAGGNYFWNPTRLSPEQIKARYDSLPAKDHTIGATAQKLSAWTKELDTTRVVTANCILPSASYVTGYADALDVIGFSYRRVMYDYGHKNFPDLPIMGTENLPQWHEWKAVMERPFISGLFLWTGVDYMGEGHHREGSTAARIRGARSGLLDYAGFKKRAYYMMKSLWTEEPVIHIVTQTMDKSTFRYDVNEKKVVEKKPGAWKHAIWYWPETNQHWNYKKGDSVIVEVISNLPSLELSLNGQSLGKKDLEDFDDRIYKWMVPYGAGSLKVEGRNNGQLATQFLHTAGESANVRLQLDQRYLEDDGSSVAHVEVQLEDQKGFPVYHRDEELEVTVDGPLELLGVDNGSPTNFTHPSSSRIKTSEGKALVIVQSIKGQKGTGTVEIKVNDQSFRQSITID
ncbi:glycoside hydrolase family 2 TIM barrel-domain containing protein [Echinicola strongylocentroti]|nr:glycoside hydrolase family 2 TIM barrel-domain containing protein [Echinicola strongylocentroti]